jgi:uncharacterized membrane protein YfcA
MPGYLAMLMLGLAIGAVSGLAGIGGGILLIPALVFFFGWTQHQAVGTTLAVMVPPVTLAAAIEYYRRGSVDLGATCVLTVAILLGSWATARFAHLVPEFWLKRVFGVLLLFVAVRFMAAR